MSTLKEGRAILSTQQEGQSESMKQTITITHVERMVNPPGIKIDYKIGKSSATLVVDKDGKTTEDGSVIRVTMSKSGSSRRRRRTTSKKRTVKRSGRKL